MGGGLSREEETPNKSGFARETDAGVEPKVVTVNGEFSPDEVGICDAHNHVWIDSVSGAAEGGPVLDYRLAILKELCDYRQAGGDALTDCQPGGCGRNGNRLLELSRASEVKIIACTGFHRARYYPEDYWLWRATPGEIADYLTGEIRVSLTETVEESAPVRAGFLKIACEAQLERTPQAPLEAAAVAAAETGSALEIHTEKGAAADKILEYFTGRGVSPARIILCHMDKRPDFALHCELAKSGALLEYDTFFRPKYDPEGNLWPLIEKMAGEGLGDHVALATDMAEAVLWKYLGGGPGLASFPRDIRRRLLQMGLEEKWIDQMMGKNIARRLAMSVP
jgi:predicted metal-dependent phosphotriesterase family hydrolase